MKIALGTLKGERPKTTSLAEAKRAYNKAEDDSDKQGLAYLHWKDLAAQALGAANDTKTVRQLRRQRLPNDPDLDKLALLRGLELASTTKETKELFDDTAGDHEEIRGKVVKKWIGLCTSVRQIREVIEEIRIWYGSEDHILAVKKWVELSTTLKEAGMAYSEAPENSSARYDAGLRRIELCTTVDDAEQVFSGILGDSEELEAIALRKIATLQGWTGN